MFRSIARILLAIVVNGALVFALDYFIPGFDATRDLKELVIIAFALTLLNFVLKPILTLFLGPIIVITLGLGLILVNALILILLDFLFPGLTISSTVALLESTLIFTAINFIFHLATKKS